MQYAIGRKTWAESYNVYTLLIFAYIVVLCVCMHSCALYASMVYENYVIVQVHMQPINPT